MTIRKRISGILQHVDELLNGDRAQTHGDPFHQLQNTADYWNQHLGIDKIGPADVAIMMQLMKISRMRFGDYNPDDYIDNVGYAAIAAGIMEQWSGKETFPAADMAKIIKENPKEGLHMTLEDLKDQAMLDAEFKQAEAAQRLNESVKTGDSF